MLFLRKSVVVKISVFGIISLLLLALFSYHTEKIQTSYGTIKESVTNLKPKIGSMKENIGSYVSNDKAYNDAVESELTHELDEENGNLLEDNGDEVIKYINTLALEDDKLVRRSQYFHKIFKLISKFKPILEPLDTYLSDKISVQSVDGFDEPAFTKEQLEKYLVVNRKDVDDLQENLNFYISNMTEIGEYPENIYEKGTNGIVYVGGEKYSWLTLMSIMNIREVGSELPIEVLIPNREEYEFGFCKDILPKYNAKCIYLPKLVGLNVFNEYHFKGYQFKSLAIALSSFENILLLDADNSPLVNPDYLFTSKVFQDNGLVLWPDFWKRTTHPAFYEIAGFDIDLTRRRDFGYKEYGEHVKKLCKDDEVLFHQLEGTLPDPSTESGQVLFSKSKHFKTILLSLYLNSYGPDYYYPLLSQGAGGEGDKETFIAAAHILEEHYYTVKKHVIALGRFRDGEFKGSAMGQFNAVEDYDIFERYQGSNEEVDEEPGLLFVHANFPKLDPWELYQNDVIIDKSKNERNRLFGVEFIDRVGYDFELKTWENMKQLLCDETLEFATFKNHDVTTKQVCDEVLLQLEYLRSTSKNV
ncbi:uncharacterized protein C5L36_0A12490 [Pichia kudriavzevii]|uniref:Alpha-1,2-mannosyltransferase MNN2 n=1 Tax=Pichia kudriavzevii TaxID=4909 RepID=A0A2U9R050_PICKU|nr:uncharacterized protein C5L36_0A12490 [Pichia kudriavzevii]AWU74673.1 hypothetical protein C5L36_0A12490 [Pichia kudriavzevii]